jgi:hypothetical protein
MVANLGSGLMVMNLKSVTSLVKQPEVRIVFAAALQTHSRFTCQY